MSDPTLGELVKKVAGALARGWDVSSTSTEQKTQETTALKTRITTEKQALESRVNLGIVLTEEEQIALMDLQAASVASYLEQNLDATREDAIQAFSEEFSNLVDAEMEETFHTQFPVQTQTDNVLDADKVGLSLNIPDLDNPAFDSRDRAIYEILKSDGNITMLGVLELDVSVLSNLTRRTAIDVFNENSGFYSGFEEGIIKVGYDPENKQYDLKDYIADHPEIFDPAHADFNDQDNVDTRTILINQVHKHYQKYLGPGNEAIWNSDLYSVLKQDVRSAGDNLPNRAVDHSSVSIPEFAAELDARGTIYTEVFPAIFEAAEKQGVFEEVGTDGEKAVTSLRNRRKLLVEDHSQVELTRTLQDYSNVFGLTGTEAIIRGLEKNPELAKQPFHEVWYKLNPSEKGVEGAVIANAYLTPEDVYDRSAEDFGAFPDIQEATLGELICLVTVRDTFKPFNAEVVAETEQQTVTVEEEKIPIPVITLEDKKPVRPFSIEAASYAKNDLVAPTYATSAANFSTSGQNVSLQIPLASQKGANTLKISAGVQSNSWRPGESSSYDLGTINYDVGAGVGVYVDQVTGNPIEINGNYLLGNMQDRPLTPLLDGTGINASHLRRLDMNNDMIQNGQGAFSLGEVCFAQEHKSESLTFSTVYDSRGRKADWNISLGSVLGEDARSVALGLGYTAKLGANNTSGFGVRADAHAGQYRVETTHKRKNASPGLTVLNYQEEVSQIEITDIETENQTRIEREPIWEKDRDEIWEQDRDEIWEEVPVTRTVCVMPVWIEPTDGEDGYWDYTINVLEVPDLNEDGTPKMERRRATDPNSPDGLAWGPWYDTDVQATDPHTGEPLWGPWYDTDVQATDPDGYMGLAWEETIVNVTDDENNELLTETGRTTTTYDTKTITDAFNAVTFENQNFDISASEWLKTRGADIGFSYQNKRFSGSIRASLSKTEAPSIAYSGNGVLIENGRTYNKAADYADPDASDRLVFNRHGQIINVDRGNDIIHQGAESFGNTSSEQNYSYNTTIENTTASRGLGFNMAYTNPRAGFMVTTGARGEQNIHTMTVRGTDIDGKDLSRQAFDKSMQYTLNAGISKRLDKNGRFVISGNAGFNWAQDNTGFRQGPNNYSAALRVNIGKKGQPDQPFDMNKALGVPLKGSTDSPDFSGQHYTGVGIGDIASEPPMKPDDGIDKNIQPDDVEIPNTETQEVQETSYRNPHKKSQVTDRKRKEIGAAGDQFTKPKDGQGPVDPAVVKEANLKSGVTPSTQPTG